MSRQSVSKEIVTQVQNFLTLKGIMNQELNSDNFVLLCSHVNAAILTNLKIQLGAAHVINEVFQEAVMKLKLQESRNTGKLAKNSKEELLECFEGKMRSNEMNFLKNTGKISVQRFLNGTDFIEDRVWVEVCLRIEAY